MFKKFFQNKKFNNFLISTFIVVVSSIVIHLYIFPALINSNLFITSVETFVKDALNLDLTITNSNLKTYLSPKIYFKTDKLILKNSTQTLIELENFETSVSYGEILKKKIKLNSISAKTLIIKADELLKCFEKDSQAQAKALDWTIDIFDTNAKLDDFELSYKQNNALLELFIKDIEITNEDNYKNIGFNFEALVSKNNKQYLDIIASTIDEIKIEKDCITIDDFKVLINNSDLILNSKITKNSLFANVKSQKFMLEDIFKSINCDFIIPDGEKMLSVLQNPKGSVSFDINLNNSDLSGNILINNTNAQLKDLSNLPLNIQKGAIKITKDKIDFVNLEGFWGKSKNNTLKISGDIKDYYKTFNSNISINTLVNNEFFKDYLAKLINNTVIFVSKPVGTKIIYKSKNNIMDVTALAKIPKGVNLGVANQQEESALKNYDRAIKADFEIKDNDLDIKNINYYIANNIQKGVKIQPIIVLDGKMTLAGEIKDLGFSFGREMPCEFLNIFTKEKIFKKGTIKGDLHVDLTQNSPKLVADMVINKTLIPSQRLFIKNAVLKTDNNLINLDAKGGFKRVKFDFSGKIKNEIKPPIDIKKLNLALDNINVETFLNSLNNQTKAQDKTIEYEKIDNEQDIENADEYYMFDTNLVRIEDCNFTLDKGNYKELTFSDIKAHLTLDNNGILNIQSNKFNIAQGISTLKVKSDLKNLKHYIRLGVKDVNTDLLSKVLFNLEKEIQGKATGLIELNTDKSLKMNGKIQFLVHDGTIGKIGLVEYLMKIVSVFRNPIAMVNPVTVMDIINIPEGKFDKIEGNILIKDNILQKIDIKSTSDTLSALIRGRFDLEKHDASIRIYTRFSQNTKSKLSFLRNISLNALANKVQLNSRNDANYYSSELKDLPQINAKEELTQVYLTQVEGDIEHNNFLSSLRKIK